MRFLYSHKFRLARFLWLSIVLTAGCSSSGRPISDDAAFEIASAENAININTASQKELETIPYIGEKIATKIIEHREQIGPFRKPEHLMLIPGISDKRFRKIRQMVKVE